MKSLLIFLCLAILVGFSSCQSSATYLKTSTNTPHFEHVGEIQANGTMGFNHIEVGGAVAPAKNIGVIGNAYWELQEKSYYELGVGYWNTYTKKKWLSLEGYVGYGRGFIDNRYSDYNPLNWDYSNNYDLRTNYNKFFTQVGAGVNAFKDVKIGGALKSSLLHYPIYRYEFERNYDSGFGYELIGGDTIRETNVFGSAFEPVLYLRGKAGRVVNVNIQVGYSFVNLGIQSNYTEGPAGYVDENFDSHVNVEHPRFQRVTLNVGLLFSIDELFKPHPSKLMNLGNASR